KYWYSVSGKHLQKLRTPGCVGTKPMYPTSRYTRWRITLHATTIRTIAICDTEPISIEGLRAVLKACEDLQVVGAETSLIDGMDLVRKCSPTLAIIDKAFGIHAVMDWIRRIRDAGTAALVWGVNMSEAEAMRLVQAGATGVVRKSAPLATLLS